MNGPPENPGPPGPPGAGGGDPPRSGLRPPWRDVPPEVAAKATRLAFLGFALAWIPVVIAVVYPIAVSHGVDLPFDTFAVWVVMFVVIVAIDLTGTIVASVGPGPTSRAIGYGMFIAMLTHLGLGALGVIILFGWCLNSL